MLVSRLRNLFRGRRHSAELDEELAFHLEMRARDNAAEGMPPGEAERAARVRFGNVALEKERIRDASIFPALDRLAQDLRYTMRSLRGAKAVSLLVVALLAVGIGANTAMFTITHALLLRNLPVKDPAGLVNLRLANFMSWGYIEAGESLTYALWNELVRRQDVLDGMFPYADEQFDASLSAGVARVMGAFTTAQAFDTLGVHAAAGRTFASSDEREGVPVAVISHALWTREFGASPAAIGRALVVDGKPVTIIGVAPSRFFGLTVGRAPDIYVPVALEPYLRGKDSAFPNQTHYWLTVFGRLRPGYSIDQANSRLVAISALSLAATVPPEFAAKQRDRYVAQRFALQPAATGLSYARDTLKKPVAILSAVTGILLLLASFSIANLLLARATSRQKEIAVRIALGASRLRIFRQLLAESLALAVAGACAGLVLSRVLAAALVRASSSISDPLVLDLSLDWTVYLFAAGAAGLSAVLFGLAPALRAAHVAPAEAFKGGGSTIASPVVRLRRALLSAQIAATTVLIAGAVLFGATLRNLAMAPTGFDRDNIALADIDMHRMKLAPEAFQAFYYRVLDSLKSLPSVQTASLSYVTPIANRTWQMNMLVENGEGWRDVHIHYNAVTPEFFATFGTRILAGRGFTARDTRGAPLVAVVNSAFARAAFGNEDPIGRRINAKDPDPRVSEIVGVVEDAKYRNLRSAPPPTVYQPLAQNLRQPPAVTIALRAPNVEAGLVRELSATLTRDYPNLSYRAGTFRAQIGESVRGERLFALIFGTFGALALFLAMGGIYGVLSYLVAQRRGEFGVRVALGAQPADIRRLVYAQSLSALALGIAAGCLVAIWAARFVSAMLYGITPGAPLAYASVVAILVAITLVATLVPALRGSRAETLNLLRCE